MRCSAGMFLWGTEDFSPYNRLQVEFWGMSRGLCSGRNFPDGVIFHVAMSGDPREGIVWYACPDPAAGLPASMCGCYDSGHGGLHRPTAM